MTSLQAHLLIASGELAEPFTRSVVLMIRHNDEGALGLILNRRMSVELKDAWHKLSDEPCQREASLFLGGPCEGPLVALHTDELLEEMQVMQGLYFCAGKEKLEMLASQTDEAAPQVKFFAGYSGWAPGQLENEIARGSWSVMPAKVEHVFGHDDELWTRSMRYVADSAWRASLGIKNVPPDLRDN